MPDDAVAGLAFGGVNGDGSPSLANQTVTHDQEQARAIYFALSWSIGGWWG